MMANDELLLIVVVVDLLLHPGLVVGYLSNHFVVHYLINNVAFFYYALNNMPCIKILN
jgi:hypothetical protein